MEKVQNKGVLVSMLIKVQAAQNFVSSHISRRHCHAIFTSSNEREGLYGFGFAKAHIRSIQFLQASPCRIVNPRSLAQVCHGQYAKGPLTGVRIHSTKYQPTQEKPFEIFTTFPRLN